MSRHHGQIKNDPRWKAARAAVLERDGYACRECGTTEQLEVHHIIPLEECLVTAPALAFDPDNLVTLCRPHHQQAGRETRDIPRHPYVNPKWRDVLASVL